MRVLLEYTSYWLLLPALVAPSKPMSPIVAATAIVSAWTWYNPSPNTGSWSFLFPRSFYISPSHVSKLVFCGRNNSNIWTFEDDDEFTTKLGKQNTGSSAFPLCWILVGAHGACRHTITQAFLGIVGCLLGISWITNQCWIMSFWHETAELDFKVY